MGPPDKSRLFAGIASAALDVLILLALVTGLRVHLARPVSSGNLIDVAFTIPPPPPEPHRPQAMPKRQHASTGPVGGQAAPVVAPVPRLRLARPTVPAATNPGSGSGAGMGGEGTGGDAGTGGSGEGSGDGGSDAEWIGGRIANSDYPSRAVDRGAQGTVGTEIAVEADGRVAGCRVTRSSGDPDLDATTCRLITSRFRFRPATDSAGHAIADTVDYEQEWVLNHR